VALANGSAAELRAGIGYDPPHNGYSHHHGRSFRPIRLSISTNRPMIGVKI
jgi:hypothetical protein